jgi:type II secretory pathway pseudopilin PulG
MLPVTLLLLLLLLLLLFVLPYALQQRDDARESVEMDQTRMARDADMAHAAAAQAQAEAALTVEGDILGAARFADSTLLRDGPEGCSVLR